MHQGESSPTKIKVLHFVSSMRRGGRERQLAYIVRHAKGDAVENRILAIHEDDLNNSYVAEYQLHDRILGYLGNQYGIRWLGGYLRIVKRWKPDIIWSWGPTEALIASLVSLVHPCIIVNGIIRMSADQMKQLSAIKRWITYLTLALSKRVVANSRYGLNSFHVKNGLVLYNGLDESFLTQMDQDAEADLRKSFGIDSDECVLTAIANFLPVKDHGTLVEGLRKVTTSGYKCRLILIGEGPLRKSIEDQVNACGLTDKVIFTGRSNRIRDYLGITDIFLHSSYSEGLSNAIMEAMASGLPVIATSTGGTPELVGEANGFLFDCGNSEQLSRHITTLISDPQLKMRLGEQSRRIIIQSFSMSTMLNNYEKIVMSFVHGSQTG